MNSSDTPVLVEKKRMRLRYFLKRNTILYVLMLPTLIGMLLFNYYPKLSVIKYSFYRWDGGVSIEEFRGVQNFIEIFTADPLFWQTFSLVGILLLANLFKMWPCIITAVVLHRLKNTKAQYIYRILFVIPMVIPGLVWLLIWKSFYDPTVGILNALLNATGLMRVLQWLDTAMPDLAAQAVPIHENFLVPAFGGVAGFILFGAALLFFRSGVAHLKRSWGWLLVLLVLGLILTDPLYTLLIPGVAALISVLLTRKNANTQIPVIGGVSIITLGFILLLFTCIWVEPTHAFTSGSPAWLGNTKLIIPAILFWGFPYVGTVGVLIYLAGLQNISNDVYEAAEIDGAGPIRKFFSIEIPLIMTQVRINLIFMTINTLSQYGLFLLLLGPSGGPGNKGMVPGLYMYREAFYNQRYGYACALGMVMFVLILTITIFYQKYVKVEK